MATDIPGPSTGGAAGGGESWAHYLDPGEALLWEGAPSGGLRLSGRDLVVALSGVVFLMGSVFWTFMAVIMAQGSELGTLFWMFGLPFIAIGLYLSAGRPFWKAYLRRRTRYALTDRRAIVACRALGRSLRSYPIDARTRIDYRPGRREASIWFAHEERRGSKGRTYSEPKGFEYLVDGETAYRAMREMQARDAERRGMRDRR